MDKIFRLIAKIILILRGGTVIEKWPKPGMQKEEIARIKKEIAKKGSLQQNQD